MRLEAEDQQLFGVSQKEPGSLTIRPALRKYGWTNRGLALGLMLAALPFSRRSAKWIMANLKNNTSATASDFGRCRQLGAR